MPFCINFNLRYTITFTSTNENLYVGQISLARLAYTVEHQSLIARERRSEHRLKQIELQTRFSLKRLVRLLETSIRYKKIIKSKLN